MRRALILVLMLAMLFSSSPAHAYVTRNNVEMSYVEGKCGAGQNMAGLRTPDDAWAKNYYSTWTCNTNINPAGGDSTDRIMGGTIGQSVSSGVYLIHNFALKLPATADYYRNAITKATVTFRIVHDSANPSYSNSRYFYYGFLPQLSSDGLPASINPPYYEKERTATIVGYKSETQWPRLYIDAASGVMDFGVRSSTVDNRDCGKTVNIYLQQVDLETYPLVAVRIQGSKSASVKCFDGTGKLFQDSFALSGIVYCPVTSDGTYKVVVNTEGGNTALYDVAVSVASASDYLIDVPNSPGIGLDQAAADARYINRDAREVDVQDIKDGAVGSSELAANSAGSSKIADGAIESADILDGTIASADVADGSLAAADVAPNQFAPFSHNHDALYSKLTHNHDDKYPQKTVLTFLTVPERAVPGKTFTVGSIVLARKDAVGIATPAITAPGFNPVALDAAPKNLANAGSAGKALWTLTAPAGSASYEIKVEWALPDGAKKTDVAGILVDSGR